MPKSGTIALRLILTGLTLLGLWALIAWLRNDPAIVPGPRAVLDAATLELRNGQYWPTLAATLGRALAAFLAAIGLGVGLALILTRTARLSPWVAPTLALLRQTPLIVVALLCLMWIGAPELAALLALGLGPAARIAADLRRDLTRLDPRLSDMARVHQMPPLARMRHVLWPQLGPGLARSTRATFGMIWSGVLVVEALGLSHGTGHEIWHSYQTSDAARLLAYGLGYSALMVGLGGVLRAAWGWQALSWRRV